MASLAEAVPATIVEAICSADKSSEGGDRLHEPRTAPKSKTSSALDAGLTIGSLTSCDKSTLHSVQVEIGTCNTSELGMELGIIGAMDQRRVEPLPSRPPESHGCSVFHDRLAETT